MVGREDCDRNRMKSMMVVVAGLSEVGVMRGA